MAEATNDWPLAIAASDKAMNLTPGEHGQAAPVALCETRLGNIQGRKRVVKELARFKGGIFRLASRRRVPR